jgi:hypothetical protein
MSPIRIPDPAEICLTVLLTTAALVVQAPGTASDLISRSDVCSPTICSSTKSDTTLYADPKAERSVQFARLASEWREERGAMSSITQMSMLPSYQRIIGMGKEAVPLILAELRSEGDEPDQWFWALRVLSGVNPVRTEDQGDFQAMARAWLVWGETQEYAG